MTDGVNRIRKFLIHTKKAIWEKGGEGAKIVVGQKRGLLVLF